MNKWLVIIIIVLAVSLVASLKQVTYSNQRWENATANVKAYESILSDKSGRIVALQLSVDQLEYFNDSVLKQLNATREELKIKDKNLKALQMIKSSFSKADTVRLTDTLYKDPSLSLDTLLGDKWYSLKLGLHYPSMVTVEPEFKSEKHIIVSTKKETVNPPKKFFLFRWFQKKHTVVHVDIDEKNPYVNDEKSEYVEIIK